MEGETQPSTPRLSERRGNAADEEAKAAEPAPAPPVEADAGAAGAAGAGAAATAAAAAAAGTSGSTAETAAATSGDGHTSTFESRPRVLSGFDTIRSQLRRLHAATSGLKRSSQNQRSATLNMKDTNLTAMLSEELEQQYVALQQKEDDLRLAAEIGQDLLQQLEASSARVQELERAAAASEAAQEELREERKTLKKEAARMRIAVQEAEAATYDVRRQLEELERKSKETTESELAKRRAAEAALAKAESDLLQARQTVIAQGAEIQQLSQDYQAMQQSAARQRKQTMALESEVEALREQHEPTHAATARNARGEEVDLAALELKHAAEIEAMDKVITGLRQELQRALAGQEQRHASARSSANVYGGAATALSEEDLAVGVAAVPVSVRLCAVGNGLLAVMLAVVGIISLATLAEAIGASILAIALGALWLAFEARPPSYYRVLHEQFAFMLSWSGRAAFMLLTAVLACSFGYLGLGLALAMVIWAGVNAFVLRTVPDLAQRYQFSKSSREGAGAARQLVVPLLHEERAAYGSREVHQSSRSGGGAGAPARTTTLDSIDGHSPMSPRDESGLVDAAGADDWEDHVDATSNRRYFYNRATGVTTFSRPPG